MNLHLDFSQPARNSVQAVLASHASDVNFGDGTETQVCFGREKQPGHAKFRNGWFRIDVPLVADDAGLPSSSDIWAALKQARELHGAKVVLPVGGESLTVRAEFAVHDSEAGNAVLAAEVCTRNACQAIAKALRPGANGNVARSDDAAGNDSQLQDQLREFGWQCTAGGNGRLSVDLEVANGSFPAEISRVPDGYRLSVDVLMYNCQETDEACRYALGLLLVRAGSAIRMAGAVACTTEDEVIPCFQVVVPAEPGTASWSDALGSLSVICELFTAEAEVLSQHPGLARAYLTMYGAREF